MPITTLAVLPHTLPGHEAGVPRPSVAHGVARHGVPFTFTIVTRDRDHDDGSSFPAVTAGEWDEAGKRRGAADRRG